MHVLPSSLTAGARSLALLAGLLIAISIQARADDGSADAVASAEDAFGVIVGRESIGLYDQNTVRGFSPTQAGNNRIEGLYFDRASDLTRRIVTGSTIRVGIAAQGYLFPAPTGIVDYSLRPSGDQFKLEPLLGYYQFGSAAAELQSELPLAEGLSASAGAAIRRDHAPEGGHGHVEAYGFVPRWKPLPSVEVIGLFSLAHSTDEYAVPLYVPSGSFLPPKVLRGQFVGPDWATGAERDETDGMIARWSDGPWTAKLGVFRSSLDLPRNILNLLVVEPDGRVDRYADSDPAASYVSWSGEARLSRSFDDGPRHYLLVSTFRGRDTTSRYGGTDELALGLHGLTERLYSPDPAFRFGPQTDDHVVQHAVGLEAQVSWDDIASIGLGAQRIHYRKRTIDPGVTTGSIVSTDWLPTLNATIDLGKTWQAYVSYTRGLEENAAAPDVAANRLQTLPSSITRQYDGGLVWRPDRDTSVVLGVFDTAKPYFSLDERNIYRALGRETHRGIEFSVSTEPAPGLKLVGGAVVLRPRVSAPDAPPGTVGRRAVGQPDRVVQLNADYTLPFAPDVSLDGGISHTGSQEGTVDNRVRIPSSTTLSLGGRYHFKLAGAPMTLRIIGNNLTDAYSWMSEGSGAYEPIYQRSIQAYISAEL